MSPVRCREDSEPSIPRSPISGRDPQEEQGIGSRHLKLFLALAHTVTLSLDIPKCGLQSLARIH